MNKPPFEEKVEAVKPMVTRRAGLTGLAAAAVAAVVGAVEGPEALAKKRKRRKRQAPDRCKQKLVDGADFSGCSFRGSNFSSREFNSIDFSGADLRECDFRSTTLNECNFANANLDDATFIDATLTKCDLSSASMLGTNLHKTLVEDSDLSWARLYHGGRSTYFRGVRIVRSRISDQFSGVYDGKYVHGSNFRCNDDRENCASLEKVVFEDMDLSGLDFINANLFKSFFSNVSFRRANLWGAMIQHAVFSNCDLSEAEFDGADGRTTLQLSTHFYGCDLTRSSFGPRDLKPTEMVGADFKNCTLDGAYLYKTKFRDRMSTAESVWHNCSLFGANITGWAAPQTMCNCTGPNNETMNYGRC